MALKIAGGTYIEQVTIPEWYELYGSAARAAAAISGLSNQVTLYTFIDDRCKSILQQIAATFGFGLETARTHLTPEFAYFHPMSTPKITPNPLLMTRDVKILVEGGNILRFGTLEGNCVVHGERVVYDPQSARPMKFSENGSTAEHLAIVANHREAALLTGLEEVAEIGASLIGDGAEVVVIKRGMYGATVFSGDRKVNIPVFETETVWKIGTGDVFSGLFAHFWGEKGLDPIEAATQASKGVALYCSTNILPINFESDPQFNAVIVDDIEIEERRPLIYIAAPFFNISQRWILDEVRRILHSEGVDIFSPLHDVGITNDPKLAAEDIKAIDRCNSVFALFDGSDEGTLMEIGYARAVGKPVVAFAESTSDDRLIMARALGCEVVKDLTTAIYRSIWQSVK